MSSSVVAVVISVIIIIVIIQSLLSSSPALPEGIVVAAAVRRTLGVLTPFPESLYVPFEELGAKSIRAALEKQNYAFLVKTGKNSNFFHPLFVDIFCALVLLLPGTIIPIKAFIATIGKNLLALFVATGSTFHPLWKELRLHRNDR